MDPGRRKTQPTLYYCCGGGATSSTASGFRGVSLTLNKTEGYERSVYETPALNANSFAALFSWRRPRCCSVSLALSSSTKQKETKHQTTKGEKSSDADQEAQEVAPAPTCGITNKTASRPRRDVHGFGLDAAVGIFGVVGLTEATRWMIRDDGRRSSVAAAARD